MPRNTRMDDSDHTWMRSDAPRFFRRLPLAAGACLVDIGCRRGRYALAAARTVGPTGCVVGIDHDSDALVDLRAAAYSEALSSVCAVRADVTRGIALGDGVADAVLLFDILHLLHAVQRRGLYAEAARVLKPGGVLAILVWHHGRDPSARHLRDRTPEDVAREVAECGFRAEKPYRGVLWHGGRRSDTPAMRLMKVDAG